MVSISSIPAIIFGIYNSYTCYFSLQKELRFKNRVMKAILILLFVSVSITQGAAQVLNRENFIVYKDSSYLEKYTGIFKIYEGETLLLSANVMNGLKHGLVMVYYPSGKLNCWLHYKNNLTEGPQRIYTENGKIKFQGNAKTGELNGKCTWYFENGTPKVQAHFLNGNREGEWYFYFENGTLQQHGFYKNNQPVGSWFINQDELLESYKYNYYDFGASVAYR